MPKIIKGKIGKNDLMTIALAGITKTVEEKALAGVVGNATIMSGLVKLGIGLAIPSFAGRSKIVDGVSLGFGIDGVEDVLTALMGGMGNTSGGGVL